MSKLVIDCRMSIWKRYHFTDQKSFDEAHKALSAGRELGEILAEQNLNIKGEYLFDTEEQLTPEQYGFPTIELFTDPVKSPLWTNQQSKK